MGLRHFVSECTLVHTACVIDVLDFRLLSLVTPSSCRGVPMTSGPESQTLRWSQKMLSNFWLEKLSERRIFDCK